MAQNCCLLQVLPTSGGWIDLCRLQYLVFSLYVSSLMYRGECRALKNWFSIILCGGDVLDVFGPRIYLFKCSFNERT